MGSILGSSLLMGGKSPKDVSPLHWRGASEHSVTVKEKKIQTSKEKERAEKKTL